MQDQLRRTPGPDRPKDLAIPIPTADYRLLKILRRHGDTILKERGPSGTGLLSKVERLMVDLLPKGMARAKVIADREIDDDS